jgi:hypothetical protein
LLDFYETSFYIVYQTNLELPPSSFLFLLLMDKVHAVVAPAIVALTTVTVPVVDTRITAVPVVVTRFAAAVLADLVTAAVAILVTTVIPVAST